MSGAAIADRHCSRMAHIARTPVGMSHFQFQIVNKSRLKSAKYVEFRRHKLTQR